MKLSPIQRLTRASAKPVRRARLTSLFFSAALAHSGCQHIGPPTIARDRLAYNEAIASSWKQQMLLNIVRLRYLDMAEFVDITQAAQNYTLTGTAQASFGAPIYPWDKMLTNLMPSLMGTRTKMDNPTVTYTPQAGSDFTKSLIAPIKPPELFNLIEEHYDNIINLAVESINDVRNYPTNTTFRKVTIAISEAYFKGDIRFPIEIDPDSKEKKVFMVIEEQDSKRPEARPKDPRHSSYQVLGDPVAFIRDALRLKAAVTKFEIVVGTRPTKDTEIAVRIVSPVWLMILLSQYVPVPESSFAKHPELKRPPVPYDSDPPLTVWSGPTKPPGNNYVAIKYPMYQGNWFWIDWNSRSGQTMIYLRTLLALADTGARPTAPVLTIPASR